MNMKQHLNDMYGRKIVPGNSFVRIEDKMGGCNIRFYFLGGFADDGRIHVQEYGGIPRTIKSPSQHSDTLILLTEDLIALKKFTPPTVTQVVTVATAPAAAKKKKASKSTTLEI